MLLSQFVLCFFNAHAQYVLAGRHQPGNNFIDIIPDTTLVGPYTHIPPQPPATFQIDIDADKINDFELYSLGVWVNSGGGQQISIRAHRNLCQIALCCIDTCQYKIAKSLQRNDTINKTLIWSNDTILYLSHTSWGMPAYSCFHNGFINDSLGNYLAVRIINTLDTIYGWIKVTNVDWSAYTVQEFASTSHSNSIEDIKNDFRVYPVPAKDVLTIETQIPFFNLILYNQFGIEILTKELKNLKTQVDLQDIKNGLYFIKLTRGNTVIIKKIIKQ